MTISIPDLKIVRTAVGVLLNASVNYGKCYNIMDRDHGLKFEYP